MSGAGRAGPQARAAPAGERSWMRGIPPGRARAALAPGERLSHRAKPGSPWSPPPRGPAVARLIPTLPPPTPRGFGPRRACALSPP